MENLKGPLLLLMVVATVIGAPESYPRIKSFSQYIEPKHDTVSDDWERIVVPFYKSNGDGPRVKYLMKRGFGSMLPLFLSNVYKPKLPLLFDKDMGEFPYRMNHQNNMFPGREDDMAFLDPI